MSTSYPFSSPGGRGAVSGAFNPRSPPNVVPTASLVQMTPGMSLRSFATQGGHGLPPAYPYQPGGQHQHHHGFQHQHHPSAAPPSSSSSLSAPSAGLPQPHFLHQAQPSGQSPPHQPPPTPLAQQHGLGAAGASGGPPPLNHQMSQSSPPVPNSASSGHRVEGASPPAASRDSDPVQSPSCSMPQSGFPGAAPPFPTPGMHQHQVAPPTRLSPQSPHTSGLRTPLGEHAMGILRGGHPHFSHHHHHSPHNPHQFQHGIPALANPSHSPSASPAGPGIGSPSPFHPSASPRMGHPNFDPGSYPGHPYHSPATAGSYPYRHVSSWSGIADSLPLQKVPDLAYPALTSTESSWSGIAGFYLYRKFLVWRIRLLPLQKVLGLAYPALTSTESSWTGIAGSYLYRKFLVWHIRLLPLQKVLGLAYPALTSTESSWSGIAGSYLYRKFLVWHCRLLSLQKVLGLALPALTSTESSWSGIAGS